MKRNSPIKTGRLTDSAKCPNLPALQTSAAISPLSLSDLTGAIESLFEQAFEDRTFWIVADVTDHSFYASKGHRYFTLVEKSEYSNEIVASLRAVSWKSGSARITAFEKRTGQRFGNGINVLLNVSVSYHQRYGLQLTVNDISAEFTIGKLEMDKQATIHRLLTASAGTVRAAGDGFQTLNNSLPLPMIIQHLALVGSSASAGYEDFMHTLQENNFGYAFTVDSYFGAVQGEANAALLADRFSQIVQSGKSYDAVVLVRGGGADTDFLLFDQYELCSLAAGFPVPIITGLGHLKNQSIIDLLVHTSTKTPTKAAEYILAHNRLAEEGLKELQQQITFRAARRLGDEGEDLNFLGAGIIHRAKDRLAEANEQHHSLRHTVLNQTNRILHRQGIQLDRFANALQSTPLAQINRSSDNLSEVANVLRRSVPRNLRDHSGQLRSWDVLFRTLSPVNLLKKGFAILYHGDRILTETQSLPDGAQIQIRTAGHLIDATTTNKKETDGDEFNL